jgi:hypothetical protein
MEARRLLSRRHPREGGDSVSTVVIVVMTAAAYWVPRLRGGRQPLSQQASFQAD